MMQYYMQSSHGQQPKYGIVTPRMMFARKQHARNAEKLPCPGRSNAGMDGNGAGSSKAWLSNIGVMTYQNFETRSESITK